MKGLLSILFFLCGGIFSLFAQPTEPFPMEKPESYKNKTLGSEKTGQKKFKAPRRFIQNTVTHYNWYFNANTKLNMVLERAKIAHNDDYSELLSFYPYTANRILSDSLELDSVIQKSSTGILIHDLRNDWTDNLLLLIGKAYFYKMELDSAYNSFQFINYLYSPKDKNEYRVPIGSNAAEGGNAMKIATEEKPNIAKKLLSIPPSRNDALIWQVRTQIEREEYGSASGLLQILQNDPYFPERLKPSLYELKALYFYRLSIPDSAAHYLALALPNAANKGEMARWEFLTAQLYELTNNREEAKKYYEATIKHTLDPELEVYARLGALKQHPGDEKAIEEQLAVLLKMGRREKYLAHRDIIYFAAAQIELGRNNKEAAKELLKKAVATNPRPGMPQNKRNAALLLLGNMAYEEGDFRTAGYYYETLNPSDPVIENKVEFSNRLSQLTNLVTAYDVIHRQDSLQQLAALPEAERDKFLKAEVRRLRKLAGLEEDASSSVIQNQNQEVKDLFGSKSKGEWYFYNNNLKSRGYNEFISKWKNRENTDNWRRAGAMQRGGNVPANNQLVETDATIEDPFSYEALLSKIPLSLDQMDISNDSIEAAKIAIGKIFFENLEDYKMVINTLDSFPEMYPYSGRTAEALYYLYFSYKKLGLATEAAWAQQELNEKHSDSHFKTQVNMAASGIIPEDPKVAMTHKYNEIYNLFIEGSFQKAVAEKASADSIYGNHYWTPQLLYIEAVYYIRQREDEKAKKALQHIVSNFSTHAMKEKAETMINVLGRRKEIEQYLTNLEITIPEEETIIAAKDPVLKPATEEERKIVAARINQQLPRNEFDKPAVSTNKEITNPTLKKNDQLVIEPKDTMSRVEIIADEPVVKDSLLAENKLPQFETITDTSAISKTDSSKNTISPPVTKEQYGPYVYDPAAMYNVVIVMHKVDPVYVTETRNAFNRYNQSRFSGRQLEIENLLVNDSIHYAIIRGLGALENVIRYTNSVEAEAPVTIVPWLPKGKYRFIIISDENLATLIEEQEMAVYDSFELKYLQRNTQ